MIPQLIATAVAIGCGIAGFLIGFLVAAIMSASGEDDRRLEEMRQRHAAMVTDWLNEKQSKGGSQ
jgi:hypothetical protein